LAGNVKGSCGVADRAASDEIGDLPVVLEGFPRIGVRLFLTAFIESGAQGGGPTERTYKALW
jgi:hypothetical protein